MYLTFSFAFHAFLQVFLWTLLICSPQSAWGTISMSCQNHRLIQSFTQIVTSFIFIFISSGLHVRRLLDHVVREKGNANVISCTEHYLSLHTTFTISSVLSYWFSFSGLFYSYLLLSCLIYEFSTKRSSFQSLWSDDEELGLWFKTQPPATTQYGCYCWFLSSEMSFFQH